MRGLAPAARRAGQLGSQPGQPPAHHAHAPAPLSRHRCPFFQANEAAAAEGRPLSYFWRRQYVPQSGMFCDPPADLGLGEKLPEVSEERGGRKGKGRGRNGGPPKRAS